MMYVHGTVPLVRVGLAEYKVGAAPMKIMTMALGSCLGIVLHDGEARIGALAHVMHPNRRKVKSDHNKAKFVDSAIELMLKHMIKRGAKKERITAKMFGGAKMFGHVVNERGVLQIGDKNINAARAELRSRGIPIVAESVGGSKGRTITFDVSDGSVLMVDAHNNRELFR
jgi:chemotaxis protein CheD